MEVPIGGPITLAKEEKLWFAPRTWPILAGGDILLSQLVTAGVIQAFPKAKAKHATNSQGINNPFGGNGMAARLIPIIIEPPIIICLGENFFEICPISTPWKMADVTPIKAKTYVLSFIVSWYFSFQSKPLVICIMLKATTYKKKSIIRLLKRKRVGPSGSSLQNLAMNCSTSFPAGWHPRNRYLPFFR